MAHRALICNEVALTVGLGVVASWHIEAVGDCISTVQRVVLACKAGRGGAIRAPVARWATVFVADTPLVFMVSEGPLAGASHALVAS